MRVLDLHDIPEWASPLIFVFQGRQVGGGFPVHPHAGFSAISIVFEDSETSLRTRDSLGNDFLVDAGGIAWTEAASGIVHDELPAEPDRELNGAQIFVNLSSAHKFAKPKVMHLTGSQVPVWRGDSGDRVRVSVGSFDGLSSPIAPTEPYNLFDVDLRTQISFEAQTGHNTVLYVLDGQMVVRTGGREQQIEGGNGLALHGDSGTVTFQAAQPTHFLLLSGPELLEPVVFDGNFIMNDQSQIESARRLRYQSALSPLGTTMSRSASSI